MGQLATFASPTSCRCSVRADVMPTPFLSCPPRQILHKNLQTRSCQYDTSQYLYPSSFIECLISLVLIVCFSCKLKESFKFYPSPHATLAHSHLRIPFPPTSSLCHLHSPIALLSSSAASSLCITVGYSHLVTSLRADHGVTAGKGSKFDCYSLSTPTVTSILGRLLDVKHVNVYEDHRAPNQTSDESVPSNVHLTLSGSFDETVVWPLRTLLFSIY